MKCHNAKYGKDYCGIFEGRYEVTLSNKDKMVLCSNCLGRWMVTGNAVISYEDLSKTEINAPSTNSNYITYSQLAASTIKSSVDWSTVNPA